MTAPTSFRKPKLHFDTDDSPTHVTFDDGKAMLRTIPWSHLAEARWEHTVPDIINITIGNWLVVVRGHNLVPLRAAIEEKTLLRVRALPNLKHEPDREIDTYASEIRFTPKLLANSNETRPAQVELDLGR